MTIELTGHEKNLIQADKHIMAIKEVRQRTDCSLYEAKHIVDAFIFSNPVIAGEIREKFRTVMEKLAEIEANGDLPVMKKINDKFKSFF